MSEKRNAISLNNLTEAVENDQKINLTHSTKIKASEINIVKRSGKVEPFNPDKLKRVCLWACDGKEIYADQLIKGTEIKLHTNINIKDLYDQLINTASNKISLMYPFWDGIASKLYLVKIYKETFNMDKDWNYPSLDSVLTKGIDGKIIDKQKVKLYNDEDIDKLNQVINKSRDFLFTYKGLVQFYSKYCLNYSKLKKLELPQHAYMRAAMALMVYEKDNRIQKVTDLYDSISNHCFTLATPIMLNALTPLQQLASCVLSTVDDSTESITETGKNLAVYSKNKGGLALDISAIRAKNSLLSNGAGVSSGSVPFLKFYESIIKGWNQGGTRRGSLAVYFNWWNIEVSDILALKSNGGTDENRARALQLACKVNRYFLEKIIEDGEVYLFDPKEVPDLLGSFGDDFKEKYENYINKQSIKNKKIKARELWFSIQKQRTETGNVYLFHDENVNEATLLNRYIGSSNLCTEIVLPSRASNKISESLVTLENGSKEIRKTYNSGEIALCNLASINLEKWFYADKDQKTKIVQSIMRAMDNTIDCSFYPVKEAKNSNQMYRFLGIGVLNFANYLALNKIKIDTDEALEATDALFDEISYMLINESCELSIEKGKFPKFYETEWSKGVLPIDKANSKAFELTNYSYDNDKWAKLREKVKTFGLRNAQIMAIAPTATSGKCINATESTEPVHDFFYKDEGVLTLPVVVSNFRINNPYYVKAFDCNMDKLIENAAVRQKWIDQAQSINMYVSKPDSLFELTKLHLKGFDLGIKTFYYLKQQKENEEYVCESCT